MQQNSSENESFNMKEFIGLCLNKWYWFVLSVGVCLIAALFFILKTPKVFTRTATILIKETAVRRSSNDLETMLNAGGMNQQISKLSNEIIALQSPDLMKVVVDRLDLDFNYAQDGRMKKHVIYGSTQPVKVTFDDYRGVASFYVDPAKDSVCVISKLEYVSGKDKVKVGGTFKAKYGESVQTPIGGIVVTPIESYAGNWDFPLYVSHTSKESATRRYNHALSASAVDMKNSSDILNLTISDQSTQRAADVLKTVIAVYNENWVDDRNKIAVSTSLFIDGRLDAIERELGSVDSDISSYKSKNVLPDVAAVSNMYMTQSAETNRQLQDLDNQLYTVRYIRNIISASSQDNQLIPAPANLSSAALSSQITRYNEVLLERNNLVASSSESNPLVINMDSNLNAMRESIISAVDNQIVTLQAQVASLQRTEARATTRLAENPNQAKYLLSVERQQKVKEALYLFLLQKREENELGQAFTAYNTRIITEPTGSTAPTEPQSSKIMLLAFILGLCIPLGVLYLKETLNTKLRGRKDLENVTMPFLGEIPLYCGENPKKFSFKKPAATDKIVVEHGKRDTINEAFRVLRTNLEFVTRDSKHQVVAVTSFNPGSGKSFIAMNLASVLAIKKIKVLVIDGDLRHASTSNYVGKPELGISDYLVGDVSDIRSLVVPVEGYDTLSILPVGTIPPNPTELIGDELFAKAIETLKQEFDIVFIDCPPVEIVADTQIIADCVDRTIFVVRAGLLERSMISELENVYKQGRYKNMSLVLNGTESQGGSYHGNGGYGYRYGYKYGYGSSNYYSDSK